MLSTRLVTLAVATAGRDRRRGILADAREEALGGVRFGLQVLD